MFKLLLPVTAFAAAAAATLYVFSRNRRLEFEVEMKVEPVQGGNGASPSATHETI